MKVPLPRGDTWSNEAYTSFMCGMYYTRLLFFKLEVSYVFWTTEDISIGFFTTNAFYCENGLFSLRRNWTVNRNMYFWVDSKSMVIILQLLRWSPVIFAGPPDSHWLAVQPATQCDNGGRRLGFVGWVPACFLCTQKSSLIHSEPFTCACYVACGLRIQK